MLVLVVGLCVWACRWTTTSVDAVVSDIHLLSQTKPRPLTEADSTAGMKITLEDATARMDHSVTVVSTKAVPLPPPITPDRLKSGNLPSPSPPSSCHYHPT